MEKLNTNHRKFQQMSRASPPPPPRRWSDGSVVSKEEGDSHTPMVDGYKCLNLVSRSRPYYFRRCKRVRPTSIESLTNELLCSILVHLPADFLYDVARLVCHRWYNIIHSYDFVNTQNQHSTYGLLLCSGISNHPILLTATAQGRVETSEFAYACRNRMIASSDGLCLCKSRPPYIINLITKQSFLLPELHGYHSVMTSRCALALARSSMKYKLIVRYLRDRELCLGILTFGVDKSWRDVGIEESIERSWGFDFYNSVATEGFVHWTSNSGYYIMTMDVETEIVKMYVFPFRRSLYTRCLYHLSTGRFLSLLIFKGCLLWEIWGMKSETGEWTKMIPDIKFPEILAKEKLLVPLGWVKFPEILALGYNCEGRSCILYNLKTRKIGRIELQVPSIIVGHVHKNNLVWL